jgi:hypothetical protein
MKTPLGTARATRAWREDAGDYALCALTTASGVAGYWLIYAKLLALTL